MLRLNRMRALAAAIASAVMCGGVMAASSDDLTTVSERSGFKKTGRYEEVVQLCKTFAAK